jgi:hypothetical protein
MIEKIAKDFHSFHRIPYVVVDGSHVLIIVPCVHARDYYNQMGFYLVLLQGVVTSKCVFWDCDIKWVGSMHDSNLWTILC